MLGLILAALYTIIFIFLIKKMPFFSLEGISKKWLTIVFFLKIIAGTSLWYIYTYHYPKRSTADIFKYFDDGLIMYKALYVQPLDFLKMIFGINDDGLSYYVPMMNWSRQYDLGLFNENRTIIRFNAICDIFSFGNYHVHTVFICFLSLIGLTGIYKTFFRYVPDKKKLLFTVVFLLPSVVLWGSAVLKEGLVLFSLGMIMFYYFKLTEDRFTILRLSIFFIFILLLFITKLYVLLVIIPSLLAHLFVSKTGYRWVELKYTLILIIFFILAVSIPNYNIPTMIADKKSQTLSLAKGGSYMVNDKENKYVLIDAQYKNRIAYLPNSTEYGKINTGLPYTYWSKEEPNKKIFVKSSSDTLTYYVFFDHPPAESYIETAELDGTFSNLIQNSPLAFINVVFRPHIFESKNILVLFSSIENLVILVFICICILFTSKQIQYKSIIYFCLLSSILLFILIGLTTPILGSVVRYKIPVLPLFLISFLLIMSKEKAIKTLPFTRKILG